MPTEETIAYMKSGKSRKEMLPLGVNNIVGYAEVARKFVGLNPKNGDGSGFILRGENAITNTHFPLFNPETGGPRVDLCTCDCVAGHDGVGCVGWGGVAFTYSSLFWMDPVVQNKWSGQIQAFQKVDAGDLNFLGGDTALYPGGPRIYNVACTDQSCASLFSGVFRQANSAVSCQAGLEDKDANESNGCYQRCGNAETYTEWLAYCEADVEDTTLGFSGHGM
mmetsp:Transcript_13708/g.29780  ORF Transcript_13708/g.29780 Transcript_13708/m.29780 type:complete len:222 (+) Transcript_13708:185-850(+)